MHNGKGVWMRISERFLLPKPMHDISDELEGLSDRAMAIVCASIIDDGLTSLLKLRLINDAKIQKKLLEGQGPLATFAAKIDAGYALNLYSKETHSDLDIIRNIRNKAAHTTTPFSFDAHESKIMSLNIPKRYFFEIDDVESNDWTIMFIRGLEEVGTSPKLRFAGTTILLTWVIYSWAEHTGDILRPKRAEKGGL